MGINFLLKYIHLWLKLQRSKSFKVIHFHKDQTLIYLEKVLIATTENIISSTEKGKNRYGNQFQQFPWILFISLSGDNDDVYTLKQNWDNSTFNAIN